MQQLVAKIPWGHNILLMARVKDHSNRLWYMQQTIDQGWSRNMLATMIEARLYERQGQSTNNFPAQLPAPQSDLAQQTLKDPYIFDFLTLEEPYYVKRTSLQVAELEIRASLLACDRDRAFDFALGGR